MLGDMLESDFNMEAELEKKEPDLQNTWIGQFLEELSGVQKKIVRMKLDGLTKADIMEQLHINEHTYSSNMKKIKNLSRHTQMINAGLINVQGIKRGRKQTLPVKLK